MFSSTSAISIDLRGAPPCAGQEKELRDNNTRLNLTVESQEGKSDLDCDHLSKSDPPGSVKAEPLHSAGGYEFVTRESSK